jgi:anti-sigma factor (TIGR02949 family)
MGNNENDEEVDCREALHRIYHFLDGELTPDRRVEIESHLNCCSPCLQMFGFEAEVRRVVANRCRDTVPSGLRARIAAAIDHDHDHEPEVSGNPGGRSAT